MGKKFFITTPIYYANGSPHIGHFLTTTVADVAARYHRLILGEENVFLTTGLDEHGTTVEQSAIKAGYNIDNIQEYVDKRAKEWEKAFSDTNISFDYFVRTTNPKHEKFAQDFIKKMITNTDVYQGTYKGKYCTGCEKFLTLSDLNDKGYCPLHRPEQTIETEEKNYFFKLSKYAPKIAQLIKDKTITIWPDNKKTEMLSRLNTQVDDISISRPKEKVAWGVPFPGDDKQTVYVWVEALMNYMSSLEINSKTDFWESAHLTLGKDINWFHNVIWPAFLLSANYPLYKASFVHGFLSIGGAKISKSLGNVISPQELIEKFGVDGARYLILSSLPYDNDTDITWEHLIEKYNADLANGLGNLVSRIAKLCERINYTQTEKRNILYAETDIAFAFFRFDDALNHIWEQINSLNKLISDKKPWTYDVAKPSKQKLLKELLEVICPEIANIGYNLQPFLPETAKKIQKQFSGQIRSGEPLFPRLQ